MSFMSIGIDLPTKLARATVALVFGVIGLIVAFTGLKNAGSNYENFLLVIAYWVAPWLGVVFVDRFLRRGPDHNATVDALVRDRGFQNWAGPISMLVGMVISIWLFCNQTKYVGYVPKHHPAFGDITFIVGFVISAGLYAVLVNVLKPTTTSVPRSRVDVVS